MEVPCHSPHTRETEGAGIYLGRTLQASPEKRPPAKPVGRANSYNARTLLAKISTPLPPASDQKTALSFLLALRGFSSPRCLGRFSERPFQVLSPTPSSDTAQQTASSPEKKMVDRQRPRSRRWLFLHVHSMSEKLHVGDGAQAEVRETRAQAQRVRISETGEKRRWQLRAGGPGPVFRDRCHPGDSQRRFPLTRTFLLQVWGSL